MGDERAAWQETEAALSAETETQTAALDGVERASSPATISRELTEVLRIRWDTPRGKKVRSALLRDLRFEGAAHLKEILSDLRSASDVPGLLDLRYVRLDGENLNRSHLAGADLTGASLAKAGLAGACLRDAKLGRARLVGAALREADLSRADLTDANLTEACLEGATLVSAVLARARAIGATFRGASLVGADLRCAMLIRAVFESADLGGARVDGAHALAGTFAKAAKPPSGLEALNELVLGETPVAVPKLERTRSGSILVQPGRATPAPPPSTARFDVGMPTPAPGTAVTKSWDTALAGLIMQRGRVSRIAIVVDGEERVIFER